MPQALELTIAETNDDDLPSLKARQAITERLCDVVSWPSTRIAPHERQLAGDLLVGLLRYCREDVRRRCAERLAMVVDAPKPVLRYLARDEIAVAAPLLVGSKSLDDVDLIDAIRVATPAHISLIAQRKRVSEAVCDAIVRRGAEAPIEALIRNSGAVLAQTTINALVRQSRDAPVLAGLLARRDELRTSQGLALFWWADRETRALLVRRFAGERTTLIAEMETFFPLGETDAMLDPEVRKALLFIERRQRARQLEPGSAPTVEALIDVVAVQGGLSRATVTELARMCGLRPTTAARMLADRGGETIAVLAKAIGLKRDPFAKLWRLSRPRSVEAFEHVSVLYETLSAAKAQTVLRYWDWGLSADAASEPEPDDEDFELAPARRFLSLMRPQDL